MCSSTVAVASILLISDSFNKNANISSLHSIVDFNVYPLAKSASIIAEVNIKQISKNLQNC